MSGIIKIFFSLNILIDLEAGAKQSPVNLLNQIETFFFKFLYPIPSKLHVTDRYRGYNTVTIQVCFAFESSQQRIKSGVTSKFLRKHKSNATHQKGQLGEVRSGTPVTWCRVRGQLTALAGILYLNRMFICLTMFVWEDLKKCFSFTIIEFFVRFKNINIGHRGE